MSATDLLFWRNSLRGLGVNRVAVLAGSVAVGGLGSRMSGGDFCSGAALSAMNILLNLFPHESGSEETEVAKSPEIELPWNKVGSLITTNNLLKGAGYLSGGIRAFQIGMLDYRSSLSLSSKIGTFPGFSSTYRILGSSGRILGGVSTYVGAPISIGLEYGALHDGQIRAR